MSWALSPEALRWISENILEGSVILELGSGEGSLKLAERYQVYSVEHDPEWVGKYEHQNLNYIYAPLREHKLEKGFDHNFWYDKSVIAETRSLGYSLIIVDGPPGKHGIGKSGRSGFKKYFHLFSHDVPILFDDYHRTNERKIATSIAGRLKCPLVVDGLSTSKQWAVVWPGRMIWG